MKRYLWGIVILFISLQSCTEAGVVFEENTNIDSQAWSRTDTKEFEFENTDTLQYLDFFFNLRTTTSYRYSNLYLFAELTAPDQGENPGLVSYDTIDIPLANLTGKWHGKVSGSMVENNVQFMTKVRLTQIGKYKFVFGQGMRDQSLGEIVDVGLKVVQSKNQ
jgi:gliding motility-associated lipoprotein GldH